MGFSDVTRGKGKELLFKVKARRIILDCLVELFCEEFRSAC